MREPIGNRQALWRVEHVKVSAGTVATFFATRKVGRFFHIASLHPLALLVAAVLGTLLVIAPLGFAITVAACVGAPAIVLATWWRLKPASYYRIVGKRIRAARRTWIYRRKWRRAMTSCKIIDDKGTLPTLLRVETSEPEIGIDTLFVRMPDGHRIERYQEAAADLAPTFGAMLCQVKPVPNNPGKVVKALPVGTHESLPYKPHQVQLQMSNRDVLFKAAPPPELDWEKPLVREGWDIGTDGTTGEPFIYRLRAPLMIAGATQSGKTSLVRTLMRAMSPDIQRGEVRGVCINPKGDYTLGVASHIFEDYTAGARGGDITLFEEPATLALEKWVKILRFRADELDANAEEFVPSVKYPLVPVVIDEAPLLVFYATNRNLRRRMRSAIAILASQGAGLGIIPIFLAQDPRVEIIQMRELFTQRFALRGAGLILNNNGDLANAIPDDEKHQGVAYWEEAGRQSVRRWRAYHTTPAEMRLIPPRPKLPPLYTEMELSPVAIA